MSEKISHSVEVERSPKDLYRTWLDVKNFPRFMRYVKMVVATGPNTSRWVMEGPMGYQIEWEARIKEAAADRRIVWESIRGDISMVGEVTFRPIDKHRTEVHVSIEYEPKVGIANRVGQLLADPAGDLRTDLQRFKAYAEGVPVNQMEGGIHGE